MERLTGQIITRPMGPKNVMANPLGASKRVLVAIVGIVAVDPESLLNVEGRQFVVAGKLVSNVPGEEIVIFADGSIDRAKEIEGLELGRALLEPLWRV